MTLLFHLGIGAIWAAIGFGVSRRQGWRQALQIALLAFVIFTALSYGFSLLPELGADCIDHTPQGAGSC